jgi:two-component system LytT family response regulator
MRVLVVEDEPGTRRLLCQYLAEFPGIRDIVPCGNGSEALALMRSSTFDALFLDMDLPGIPGHELMGLLPEPRPPLVITTAHAQHALAAFQVGAAHYLLKPVDRAALAQSLARIQPRNAPLQKDCRRIPARVRGATRLLDPQGVDALVADLGDCLAWTAEGRLRVEGTLALWEERLAQEGFCRAHRVALVRLGAVQEISEAGELVVPSGKIAVSRRRLEEIRRLLGAG